MSTIRLLPAEVRQVIAAGEVISRPLDVMRELIDNALDAQASRIEIEVNKGGLELLSVRDNGVGIPYNQLELAPLRHATSKLHSLADVDCIQSLGFRGEALWSMAWAGQLTFTSRPQDQLGAGQLYAHGDTIQVQRVSAAAGSKVQIRALFAHLPARLATQASAASEYREMVALLSRYVLHYPDKHWKLSCDQEVKLQHTPSDTQGAVGTVYGSISANRLIAISTLEHTDFELSGMISRPELARVRRDRLHLAINGRPVQLPSELERAILEGYGELLPVGHAPMCILNINLPYAQVNPNIHPSKAQVALAGLNDLANHVQEAIRLSLAAHPLAQALPDLHPLEAPNDSLPHHFPLLQPIGIYRELYIVAEGEGDLWLLDAHAAHERIWYERLQQAFARAEALELSQPEMVQLTPETEARFIERQAILAAWGLQLEGFGAHLVRVRSIPAVLAGLPIPQLIEQVLHDALAEGDPLRNVLGHLACAPALKAGEIRLSHAEPLLQELSRCQLPWACPHGRPTVLRLSERELAHAFGRRSARDLPKGRDLKT